jgi:ankyrin repeat protein
MVDPPGVAQILAMMQETNSATRAVKDTDPGGYTALHLAARNGHAGVAQLLIKSGNVFDLRACE